MVRNALLLVALTVFPVLTACASKSVVADEHSPTVPVGTYAPFREASRLQLVNQESTPNPFDALLGPVYSPPEWSVRPCTGAAPLLCIYEAGESLGAVKLMVFRIDRHPDFQNMLNDAGIRFGAVDVTSPEFSEQAHQALRTYAAAYLADIERDREITFPDAYTFSSAALEEIQIGDLSGIAFGFAGFDHGDAAIERWFNYAALDNEVLYHFATFFSGATPGSFASDEELLLFEPYLRQTLADLRLPVGGDWHSPGAELPPGPRLIVQRPDNSIQYVTLDGPGAVLVSEAPASLLPAGFGLVSISDGPVFYVRQAHGGVFALETKLGVLIPLDFIPSPASPLAVRILSEGPPSEGPHISLAWSGFSATQTASAYLNLAAPDGSYVTETLAEAYGTSDRWSQFVPWRWSGDGRLFFTKEPLDGMGGFRPFTGAANLWVLDPASGESQELVSESVTRGELCLDAIAADDRIVAHHCHQAQITLMDPQAGEMTAIGLPDRIPGDARLGSVRFSPDGLRIAFSATTGGHSVARATAGRGFVVVSGVQGEGTRVVAQSEPGEWFSVVAWLWDDTLILQSYSEDPSVWPAVWRVRPDGSNLAKLADGTFLGES